MLGKHKAALKALAEELLDHETVDGSAIRNALAGMGLPPLVLKVVKIIPVLCSIEQHAAE
jgi:hypothetical protein